MTAADTSVKETPGLDGLLWRGLAWCVLVVAFGMAIYRAGTQTIAHDEAHVQ